MFFILSKILLFLIKPIIWVIALIIWGILTKRQKQKQRLMVAAFAVLFLFSNGFIVGKLTNAYEADYPKKQKFDVGIVLGGFSNLNERNNKIAFNSAGDRLFQTISLYKSGEIARILITGGNGNLIDTTAKEANYVVNYLEHIGIPDSAILIETQSRNTIENARYSLALIDKTIPKSKILVITSAWHIPRAKLIFDKQSKSKIEYYPTNFSGSTEYDFGDYIIPSASALNTWEMLFKEWIGLGVDSFRA